VADKWAAAAGADSAQGFVSVNGRYCYGRRRRQEAGWTRIDTHAHLRHRSKNVIAMVLLKSFLVRSFIDSKLGSFNYLVAHFAQPFIYLFVDRSIARSRVRSARTGGYFEQAAAAALEAFELFELLAAMEAAIFNLACEFEKAKATSIKKKAEPKRFIYDP